jgi:excisionase family DNA binding protein
MENQLQDGPQKLAHSLYEAAELLGVSVGHLRNEYKRGKLRLLKSGRRTLILDRELRRYCEEAERERT